MAEEYILEGVKLDELDPVSVLNNESIFLVGINKTCHIITLRSLKKSFNTDDDKDCSYYNQTYIDNMVNNMTNDMNDIRQNINNLSNQLVQDIQNINNKVTSMEVSLNNKIDTRINEAITALEEKNNQLTTKVNNKLTEVDNKITEFSNKINNKSDKSTKVSTVLSSSSWVGDGSQMPYTITLSISGVTDMNVVEIALPGNATLEQVESWLDAVVVHGSQSTNSVTLKAYGEKPEIDIPIDVIIRGDL